jgi:hypothetical protein
MGRGPIADDTNCMDSTDRKKNMSNTLKLSLGAHAAQLHDAQTGALVAQIEIGHEAMASRFFTCSPLDAGALERAIDWTEDRIQAARAAIPAGAQLFTHAEDVRVLAQAAGMYGGQALLHVDAVEQLFSRLVLKAFGQSPHQQDLPDSPRVFATVVFLRELLQHLGFAHIRVETQEDA